jgi:hypothetical protein
MYHHRHAADNNTYAATVMDLPNRHFPAFYLATFRVAARKARREVPRKKQTLHFFNFVQIFLNNRADMGRMPIGVFWCFRPNERQMPDLPGSVRVLKHRQRLTQHCTLAIDVIYLTHRTAKRVFYGSGTRYADGVMELGHRCKHNCGKVVFLN